MLSKLLIGKDKEDVIDSFHSKDYMSHSEIVDMIVIGNVDIIKMAIEYGLIDDISDVTISLDTLVNKEIKLSEDIIKIFIEKLPRIYNHVNWRYYYGKALHNNLPIAEQILKHKLVSVDTKDYGIIVKYIVNKDVDSIKKIIKKYDIDILDIVKLAVGSYMYSKECFKYFASLTFPNNDTTYLREIIKLHDEVEVLKYMFANNIIDDELNVNKVIQIAIMEFRPQVIEFIMDEKGMKPEGDINELVELAKEYGYNEGDIPQLGI